jgi:hypothetical protein
VGLAQARAIGSPCGVQRVALAATVAVESSLGPTTASVQGIACEADDVEGVHHRDRVRKFLGGGGLKAGEPVHRNDRDRVTLGPGDVRQPGL